MKEAEENAGQTPNAVAENAKAKSVQKKANVAKEAFVSEKKTMQNGAKKLVDMMILLT